MKRIKLTSYVNAGPLAGSPGDELDVTEGTLEMAQQLVKDRGAVAFREDVKTVEKTASDPPADDDENTDGLADELTGETSVEELKDHGIGARYVSALVDAKLLTIGDVIAKRETLAEVPGISPKAAASILEAIDKSKT